MWKLCLLLVSLIQSFVFSVFSHWLFFKGLTCMLKFKLKKKIYLVLSFLMEVTMVLTHFNLNHSTKNIY